MMEGLVFLAVILLVGTLSSVIAMKLNVSNVFFLVFIGMLFGILKIGSFPEEGIVLITIIGLVMIVFTSAVKIKIKELVKYSHYILKFGIIYFIFTFVFLSTATYFLFDLKSLIVVFLFTSLVYGIDPSIALTMLADKKGRVSEILRIEAIINTPITVIASLTFLNLLLTKGELSYTMISGSFLPFLNQFVYAVFVGVVFGFLIVFILKKSSLGNLNYIILITSAIITYVSAEYLKGNGILAVTIFGLIFGNYHFKKKLAYEKFVSIFSDALRIIVFILLGTILILPKDNIFIIKGTFLFLIYLLIRFLAVQLSLRGFRLKEKIFMCLNVPKGIDVAVIILMIISGVYSGIGGLTTIVSLCLLFILYSIVLSTIATRLEEYFLSYNKDVKKKQRN